MSDFIVTTQDEKFMRLAIALSERGRVTAPPNPWVGCVIIKDGEIVGQGFHVMAGGPHAEIVALQQAKDKSEGATVYVTLEPCAHYGKTPPCVEALIKAKVARVVVSLQDPDDRVNGKGVQGLCHAGIVVTSGVVEEETRRSLAPYLFQREMKRPYCVAKAAISIDGRIAAMDHSSQWISCAEARLNAHQIRAESQAILIGVGTAIADSPTLTVRDIEIMPLQQPLRVVLDSTGRLEPPAPLFDSTLAPTLIITTSTCEERKKSLWKSFGIDVEVLPYSKTGKGIDLYAVMDLLQQRGVVQVLIEGGSSLLGESFACRLINHLVIYVGPRVIGKKGIPLFGEWTTLTMREAPKLRLDGVVRLNDSVRLDYTLL